MRPFCSSYAIAALFSLTPLISANPQAIAAGGGQAATTLAASQYPTTTTAGSLFTLNGVTSATWVLYTQTFASTALGTWALGATPSAGTIGLGSIAGTVGSVKTKRALPTQDSKA